MLHARLGNWLPMFRGTVVPSPSRVQMSFTLLGYFDCWTWGHLRCLENVGIRLSSRAESHPRRAETNPISSSNTATYLPTKPSSYLLTPTHPHTYPPNHLPHLPIYPPTHLPTYLPYIPTYPPTHPPTYLPTTLNNYLLTPHPPTYPPTHLPHLPIYPPTHPPTYLPYIPTYLHPPTQPPPPPTYLPTHPPTYLPYIPTHPPTHPPTYIPTHYPK